MHEQAERLYQAADQLKGVKDLSGVATLLNQSAQTVKNWESRGVSFEGALLAYKYIGCDPVWLMEGIGSPGPGLTRDQLPDNAKRLAQKLALISEEKLHAISVLLGIKL